MTTTSPPEQGQLVQVRARPWVVNSVKPSSLPSPAMKLPVGSLQTLITLASVEDDGLGEELQVVWEIEPGAKVVEKVALPDPTGFDTLETLPSPGEAIIPAEFKRPGTTGQPASTGFGKGFGKAFPVLPVPGVYSLELSGQQKRKAMGKLSCSLLSRLSPRQCLKSPESADCLAPDSLGYFCKQCGHRERLQTSSERA